MGKVTTRPLIIISIKVGIRWGFSMMCKCEEERKKKGSERQCGC